MWHGRAKKRLVFTQAVSGPMKKGASPIGESANGSTGRSPPATTSSSRNAPVRPDQFDQHAPPHPVPPAPNRTGSYSARPHIRDGLIFNLGPPPPLSEPAAKAANPAGTRCDNFVAVLGRRLNQGPKLRQEIPEDVNGRQAED
jgi:hypothetical protein